MAVYNLPNYTNAQGFGLPLNIRRGNPNPLDNSAVWASLDAAKNYAKTDPTAYVGQIISVVDNANSVVDVYKINDTAGNLVLVGTVTLGDDQSIVKNDDDTLSLYDFGKKYYKFVAAEGEVAAHYEAIDGWKDGLEPKVSGGVLAWYEPNPTTVDGLQSAINTMQAEVDTNKENIKANTDAIAVLNGDKTTEGSVAYQIAAVVAGADADFDTLKEIADWIAAHPDSVAAINEAIKGNSDAIDALEELVGTDAVADQITAAIEALNIAQYAKQSDLEVATGDITANADAIEELQGLVGEGTVDERINDAIKETVEGVEQDKFALRVHGHTVSDVDGLGARLDTLATKDTVNAIDGRVQALEDGLDTSIDAAIQEHVTAADAKYETIENVSLLSGQVDTKVAALEKADTDNLAAAKTYTEEQIAALKISEYAKQADLDDTNAVIDAIKDHDTVDSFADVMAEVEKKQDIIPENTYDAYGAAAAVDTKLETYKTEANGRLAALEAVDNATQAEMDAAVDTLEAADAAILAKIGTVNEGETVVGLIGAAQTVADNAQDAADAAQGDVDALEAKVGAVPEGSDTVIAYVNKKAQEVLEAATGGSSESAASVKLALDNYKAENDPKVAANTTAAANAQTKADEAYELAETKATMDEVNDAIANAGHAVASEVEAAIDGINDKIGEVPADSTVMAEIAKAQTAATYDDTEVRGLISDNADAIKAISDDYLKAADKTELTDLVTAEQDRAEGVEQDHETRIATMEAFWDGADNSAEAIDKLKELQEYIASDESGAAEMAGNIQANTQAIAKETEDRTAADNALGVRIDNLSGVVDTKAAVSDLTALTERVTAEEGKVSTLETEMDAVEQKATDNAAAIETLQAASATHATTDALNALETKHNEYETAHASDYTNVQIDAAIDADVKVVSDALDTHEADAVAHITADERASWNGVVSDLDTHKAAYDAKVAALEAEDADIRVDFAAADTTLQGNIDTVSGALNTYKTENNAAVALKADASAVYTKAEVEDMLTWGSF